MALPIRDGNQSLTTLSTLVVNSAHVPAHTIVSLGSQAITDIAQAVSGVELGQNTLNALENISVTISAGSSITVGNIVSVTGGLTNAELRASSVTIGGSVQVSNLPATQTVTFTQASVTFGQAIVSASNINPLLSVVATEGILDETLNFVKIGGRQDGSNQTAHIVHVSAGGAMKVDNSGNIQPVSISSVTVGNFPATQTVTFSNPTVTGTVELGPTSLNALESITVTMGQVTVTGGLTDTQLRASAVTISGTVTANAGANFSDKIYEGLVLYQDNENGFSIKDLPAISGTVTANGGDFASKNTTQPASAIQLGFQNIGGDFQAVNQDGASFPIRVQEVDSNVNVPISGTVTANVIGYDGSNQEYLRIGLYSVGNTQEEVRGAVEVVGINGNPLPISGTVTVGNSVTVNQASAITVSSAKLVPSIQTNGIDIDQLFMGADGAYPIKNGVGLAYNSSGQSRIVSITQGLPIQVVSQGSVTIGAMPNGSLTTHFGTPTTASSVFATSAVTNTSRKYLLIQNVTTQSNVITVGIGFTPTTTQGIQLTAGAGITFESSYIPTGAVYVLSSVTASNFTILEA